MFPLTVSFLNVVLPANVLKQASDYSSSSRRVWPHAPTFPATDAAAAAAAGQHISNWYAAAAAAAAEDQQAGASSSSSSGMLRHTISCADRRHALVYFNSPAVRAAVHAGTLEEAGR
jgi:hypothetical protein